MIDLYCVSGCVAGTDLQARGICAVNNKIGILACRILTYLHIAGIGVYQEHVSCITVFTHEECLIAVNIYNLLAIQALRAGNIYGSFDSQCAFSANSGVVKSEVAVDALIACVMDITRRELGDHLSFLDHCAVKPHNVVSGVSNELDCYCCWSSVSRECA